MTYGTRGVRVALNTMRTCTRCRLNLATIGSLWCGRCLLLDAPRTEDAPPTAGMAIHRASFSGCRVELRISATGGATYRWSPHPAGELPSDEQARVRTQFTSFANRFIREYAARHGLAVRRSATEPDLLEPCEAQR